MLNEYMLIGVGELGTCIKVLLCTCLAHVIKEKINHIHYYFILFCRHNLL